MHVTDDMAIYLESNGKVRATTGAPPAGREALTGAARKKAISDVEKATQAGMDVARANDVLIHEAKVAAVSAALANQDFDGAARAMLATPDLSTKGDTRSDQ